MAAIPGFEAVAIVGDEPTLVAQIASLFTRPNRYLTVLDGPRMSRSDWSNEVLRRSNALVMTRARQVILANLPAETAKHLSKGWPDGSVITVTSAEDAALALMRRVKVPTEKMAWGSDNLGVGLMLARRAKKALHIADGPSPPTGFVPGGKQLLIVCEAGEQLAHIVASNLAFATGAAFLVIPRLPKDERDEWLEELYAIGSGGDVSARFEVIRDRARRVLPDFKFDTYKQIMFATHGFPWGIAVPECATTHMYCYPDFGRSTVVGIWASQESSRSARNALLIHPKQVQGSEIESIAKSLSNNGTLVRIQAGPKATVHRISTLVDTLPFDIMVLSTHAGDIPGERATYEFTDSDGLSRRLVIDHALVIGGYDPRSDKFLVHQFQRFHELDGVDWTNSEAKAQLPVGSAITSWLALGDLVERNKYKVESQIIPRVIGSMGLQMHNHVWMPILHGFAPNCSPIVVNNACSSWHQLSLRFMFARARAYVGTLFPVTEVEAQEIGTTIFQEQLGAFLPTALWVSQNSVYGTQNRRPYVMVGLPFCSVRSNRIDSIAYLANAYRNAIAEYAHKTETSPFADVRENSRQYKEFLSEDFQTFSSKFKL